MEKLFIDLMRVNGYDGPLPAYQSEHAAGMDLYAHVTMTTELRPGIVELIPTGVAVAIPSGYEGQVRPRSGLALNHAVTLVNAPGTIDADYRGEIRLPMINLGKESFSITPHMRIAQLVVGPVSRVVWQETDELSETSRGGDGFGSTGVDTAADA